MNPLPLDDVLAIRAMEHDERHYVHRPEIDDSLDRGAEDYALLAARARKYFETVHGGSDTLLRRAALGYQHSRTLLLILSVVLGGLFGLSADYLGSGNSEVIPVKRYAVIVFVSLAFMVYSCVCLLWLWWDLARGRPSPNTLLRIIEWFAEVLFTAIRKLGEWLRGRQPPGTVSAIDAVTRPLYQFRSTAVFLSRLGCVFTIASLVSAGLSAFAMSVFSKPDYVWQSLLGAESQRSSLDYFPPLRVFSEPPTPALVKYLHGDHGDHAQRLAFTWMLVDVWLLILAVKLAFLLLYWLTERAIPREMFVSSRARRDPYPHEVIQALRTPRVVAEQEPAPIQEPQTTREPEAVGRVEALRDPRESTAISPPAVAWFDGKLPETFQSAFDATASFHSLTGHSSREEFLTANHHCIAVGFKATLAPAQKEIDFLRRLLAKGGRVALVLSDIAALRDNYSRDAGKVKARLDDWRNKIQTAGWPPEAVVEFDHESATSDSLKLFRAAINARWELTETTSTDLHRAGRFDRAAAAIRKGVAERIREPQRDAELLKSTHDAIRDVYQRDATLSFADLLKTSLPSRATDAAAEIKNTLSANVSPEWLQTMTQTAATLTKVQTHGRSLAKWGVAGGLLAAATVATGGAAILPAALLPMLPTMVGVAGLGAGLSAALVRLRLIDALPAVETVDDEGVDPFFRGLVLWALLLEYAGSSESALLEELPKRLDAVGEEPIMTVSDVDAALQRVAAN